MLVGKIDYSVPQYILLIIS